MDRQLSIEIEGATPDVIVTPANVPFRALFEVLEAFADAILAAAIEVDDSAREELADRISLVAVEHGSAKPAVSFPEILERATDRVLECVETRDFSRLSVEVNRAMRRVSVLAIARRWNLKARRRGWREDDPPVEISETSPVPEPPVPPTPVLLHGETVLYGKVIAVGGDRAVKVTIKPLNASSQVSSPCDEKLACEFAQRLFQVVGVSGVATWDAHTLELLEFEARGLTDYRDTGTGDAFRRLREAAAGAFDSDEVLSKIKALRDGE
ncbi:MAG: hypothetical protein KIT58_03955 [Planctomycetota bacterium]|nr:hypothetical protein [Planctomycetota bacterium]